MGAFASLTGVRGSERSVAGAPGLCVGMRKPRGRCWRGVRGWRRFGGGVRPYGRASMRSRATRDHLRVSSSTLTSLTT